MRAVVGAFLLIIGILAAAPAQARDAAERAYARGQYALSAELFLREAQRGRALAQTFLAYQYQKGWGVPKSYEEAANWFQRAAEQGEPTAQFFLALLYDRGQGVVEDPIEASKWLNLAASHAPRGRREYWRIMRDEVDGKLTLDELTEARRRAVAWQPIFER